MTKIEWVFNTYPETGLDDIAGAEYMWSDLLLVKCVNGDVNFAYYCPNKKMWYFDDGEWVHWNQVVCWASLGKVPESLTPMPKPERSNNGEV